MRISASRSGLVFPLALLMAACASSPTGQRVSLPEGGTGIGFDDLRYSPNLHRVLVPAGRTGTLDLVDPDTLSVTSISGFGSVVGYSGSHDDGPTSVDEGNGVLYVTDRTTGLLDVVDPAAGRVIASVALGSTPDYIRFVQTTNELWVTEPGADQVEIFTLGPDPTVAPVRAAVVAVTNGPESMVIDNERGRAYTHRWQTSTVAIDLASRAIVAEWQNGCAASRGIALDEARGFLFASCSEGTTSVIDVANGGRMLSTMARGSGFDVMGYAPQTGHLYLAGNSCGCLVTLGVSAQGALSFISRVGASGSTHCAVADDAGHAWWCDQDQGSVWRVNDASPSSL
jgi:DNA-binding beta-propeller fold protein YncE